MMGNGLGTNSSVISMVVMSKAGGALFDALAAALPLNSTLQELSFGADYPAAHLDWSPLFLALGRNAGLKTLMFGYDFGSMEESLCTAMQNGIGANTTLERLALRGVPLRDDNVNFWCRSFSFLRTNKALKSLVIHVHHDATESCLSAFCINIMSMLQENASLESLTVQKHGYMKLKAEMYVALVTMLQRNTTLKIIECNHAGRDVSLTKEEDKRIAAILKKNYALETILNSLNPEGDVSAILRLNAAGRRYLIEDGNSIPKGVEVLSRVNNDINCVFFHLLENPRLCDRSAVEVASENTEESRGLANPANHNGKRDQGQPLEEGKESRRRRT
jgi:hypothetical protein